jgi:hypothetical protein
MEIIDKTWDLPQARPYIQRDKSKIEFIALHHTASSIVKTPLELANEHIARGWSGLGYNFLVYNHGLVYKTRAISDIPACVHGFNTKSICIAYVGDCEKAPPSNTAVTQILELMRALRRVYPNIKGFDGHGHFPNQATACPGKYFPLSRMREVLVADGTFTA